MKKLLIASAVCAIPVLLLGVVNPLIILFTDCGKGINHKVVFIYAGILLVCITIITVTTFKMAYYANKVDKFDKEILDAEGERDRLRDLIRHYNKLISNIKP